MDDMRMPQPAQRTVYSAPPPTKEKVRRNRSSPALVILMCLVLIAAGAAAGYYWRDQKAKDTDKVKQAEISALQAKNTKLEKDLADAKKASAAAAAPTSVRPSQATLDSIKAAIVSGNTAALDGYMASTVRVIIAASSGVGDRTPTQAINDLKYIDNATDPWDFALPSDTLSEYRGGDYKQYFPNTAYVGKSANKYVISFQFDAAGKINGIFLTNNSDLL
jgi:hypothetical protein